MKKNRTQRVQTRRQFLTGTALAVAAFNFVPASVLGRQGAPGPNSRLNLAGVGIGGQGSSDLSQLKSENIVALCDVDARYAGRTFNAYPQAKRYQDYRKMFEEQKDIDGVVVATPDHLHALVSMQAMRLGKHVYCEKPLTHSVWEARQMTLAARQFGVATQMGNQGQASAETRRLCEWIAAGAIGPVREAHIWTDRPSNGLFGEYWPQGVAQPKETPAVPETLAWDLWLGPAPVRPYHPAYLPFKWRGWWDFGTGALGDMGCHFFDPVFRALKLGPPTSVEASSSRVNDQTYPLSSLVQYQFPSRGEMPAVKLTWYDGGLRPPRPANLPAGLAMETNGRMLVGDQGIILNNRIVPESRRKEFESLPPSLPRSVGHYQEWIAACKGGKPAGSNFDWAGPLAETVLLGNVALRSQIREELTRTRLEWDAPQMKCTNLEEANAFLRREYRAGWTL